MVKVRKVVEVEVNEQEFYAQLRGTLDFSGPSDRFELEKGDVIDIRPIGDVGDELYELTEEDPVPEAVVVSQVDYSDNTVMVHYFTPDGEHHESGWIDPEGYVLLDKYDATKPTSAPTVTVGTMGQYEKTKW